MPVYNEELFSEIGKGCRMCEMILEDRGKDFCSLKCEDMYFEILCPGHAPLVISELSKVDRIKNVKYISEKSFEVYYDASKINKEKILSEDICKEFNVKEE